MLWNPSNPKECITDKWRENPEMYDAFLNAVYAFRVALHKMIETYKDMDDRAARSIAGQG